MEPEQSKDYGFGHFLMCFDSIKGFTKECEEVGFAIAQDLLEGSWYLLTTYNCTYNPTYNTPQL